MPPFYILPTNTKVIKSAQTAGFESFMPIYLCISYYIVIHCIAPF